MMKKLSFKIIKGEGGQLLTLAIILLGAGTLLVIALMPQITTMLQSGYKERELAMGRYAAEAGLNRVAADMIRGADAYPTTYTTTEPHTGGTYQTFYITTSYTAANVTVNNYTPSVTISLPSPNQTQPTSQQSYVDPGVTNPNFATVDGGYAYLMRLYNVKTGTLQVNWAYSPTGTSRVGVWAGMPVDTGTGAPYPPGRLDRWPSQHPILDTGSTPSNVDSNRTAALVVNPTTDGSGGVYTIVFYSTGTKTTKAFQPSGGPDDTWIYVKAYKDYLVSATAANVTVSAYLRQVPGFSEPPAITLVSGTNYSYTWASNNVPFITNGVYIYTWSPP